MGLHEDSLGVVGITVSEFFECPLLSELHELLIIRIQLNYVLKKSTGHYSEWFESFLLPGKCSNTTLILGILDLDAGGVSFREF
jgi:hypothetical protein